MEIKTLKQLDGLCIECNNADEREKFQKLVYSLGGEWASGENKEILYQDKAKYFSIFHGNLSYQEYPAELNPRVILFTELEYILPQETEIPKLKEAPGNKITFKAPLIQYNTDEIDCIYLDEIDFEDNKTEAGDFIYTCQMHFMFKSANTVKIELICYSPDYMETAKLNSILKEYLEENYNY